jgi:hypothetical protein
MFDYGTTDRATMVGYLLADIFFGRFYSLHDLGDVSALRPPQLGVYLRNPSHWLGDTGDGPCDGVFFAFGITPSEDGGSCAYSSTLFGTNAFCGM